MTSKSSDNPSGHPIQASESSLGMADNDPGAGQEASFFSGHSLGPEGDDGTYITNNNGTPYPDYAHSKNVGGVPVISDTLLFEKWQTFNRSQTLGRVAHSAGSGAFGHFECTKDMSSLTKADLYNGKGKKTPVFVRFSAAFLGKESPDQGRSPRGFAIKHDTKDGIYDIVGLNWPVFFCRDPVQGPDVFLSQQRNPKNFLPDYNATFHFLANVPESNHAAMMLFSNHGHPKGWRKMNGYGCHTFKWVNKEGQFVYVKYHFICDQGSEQFTWGQAKGKCGEDPDFSKRDLWEAIEKGEPVTWTAKVQVMKPEQADAAKLGFDPFDVTKIWPREEFPMHEFGKLVLDRNPKDYHHEVEQAAFSPSSMVPGIEESPDMLLHARMAFYRDAQLHRLGANFHRTQVNCPFESRFGCGGNTHYIFFNSSASKCRPDIAEVPYQVSDNIVSRQSHYHTEGTRREYDQARVLYGRIMSDKARTDLHDNTAAVLKLVTDPDIQTRYLAQCYCVNPEYAKAIYCLLPEPAFDFGGVEDIAEDAPSFGKERKFMPFGENHRLVGNPATIPTYQM
ncbi:catalase [Tuber borchii]|uniref:Catalase n=1 Tax=Tuber borchii TaxID=42251 RepID=A0A2T6ZQJ0_TUBBO|nr:catalase [Tuber borchii]